MFALSTLPLIAATAVAWVRQVWYADDSAAAGSVLGVKGWFDRLRSEGDEFGYEVKLSKTVAIVKPEAEAALRRAFGDLIADATDPASSGLRVVCCGLEDLDRVEGKHVDGLLGQRYLGAAVGSKAFREERVQLKVKGWVTDVLKLAALGRTYPHQAYSLLLRSLLPRWRYTMRTFQVDSSTFLLSRPWFTPSSPPCLAGSHRLPL